MVPAEEEKQKSLVSLPVKMPERLSSAPILFMKCSSDKAVENLQPISLEGSVGGQIIMSQRNSEEREMGGLTGVQGGREENDPLDFDGCHEVLCLATSKSSGVMDHEGGSGDSRDPGAFKSGTELSMTEESISYPDPNPSHDFDSNQMEDMFSYWESTLG